MAKNKTSKVIDKIGEGIGVGIIAGLAGTVAITLSQMIEMKITGRKPSTAPADAASKVLDIQPKAGKKESFSNEVHWAYGTLWGIVRGMLNTCGIRGWAATGVHCTAILGTGLVIEPALKVAPPLKEWKPKDIDIDTIHHIVYAVAAGLVFDAIIDNDK